MPPSVAHTRRFWPAQWGAALRNRLQFFRLLTLVLALVPLFGVGLAYGVQLDDAPRTALTLSACALLAALWTRGYRRDGIALGWVPIELALYVAFAVGIQDDFGFFSVMYIALQHRALFGTRRNAFLLACAYAVGLLFVYAVFPSGPGAIRDPIVLVELTVGAFAAYMMHTLSEVLRRDHERKLALRESEQRFRSVLENLREALLITDRDDRIVLANARVLDVLGYTPEEMTGRTASDFFPESEREAFRERTRQRLAGHSELYETEIIRKDGSLMYAEISAAPYRDATGTIVGSLGAVADISNRKRLEDRLHEALRMQAVGQLAGGVAHDFNNLLTVIKLHTELLMTELGDHDPNRDSVAQIARSADRGAALTQQLLAFSGKQLLQPRKVVLGEVVSQHEDALRGLLKAGVELSTADDSANTLVLADPVQMQKVLVALVRNANDAMPRGGRVQIRTRIVEVDEDAARRIHREMLAGRYVELSVSDTGIGMPPDVIAHMFEPFVTTKEPGEGSGLGLASVYGVVRQSGGYVDVQTAANRGTTFRTFFPVLEAPPVTAFARPDVEFLPA